MVIILMNMLTLLVGIVMIIKGIDADNYRIYHEWSMEKQDFMEKKLELPSNASYLQNGFFSNVTNEPWMGESQAKQDLLVRDIFQSMKNGYFLDIAANDWIDLSNTYRLEKYLNWTGVCVEPNPMYFVGLLSNRKCELFTNPLGANNNETIRFFLKPFLDSLGKIFPIIIMKITTTRNRG